MVRKHPLLATILIKANFFHMSSVLFLSSLAVNTWPVILFGVARLTGGIVISLTVSNISKGYKVKNDWIFRVNDS